MRKEENAPTAYMAVVQGKSIKECRDCIKAFADYPFVSTLGIPKHLIRSVGIHTRMDLARWVDENLPHRFGIHFLGSSPLWLEEIKYVNDIVRSMDTSMPFVQAYHGKKVDSGSGHERPPNYFLKDKDSFEPDLVRYNVGTMLEWADGRST
jgi:hypothetical protein